MSRFFVEPFAGATGANLTARQPDVGGPWAKVTGATADIVLSLLNRARGNSNALARYVVLSPAETADYDVLGTVIQQSAVGGWWFTLRGSQAVDTCYAVGYTGAGWQIVRRVNGAATTLASFAQAWAVNETKPVRVRIRGSNPVTIEVLDALINGNVLFSASDASAARLTDAGLVGLHINPGTSTGFNNRSYHIGMMRATALPVDPRPRAAKPADGPLAARVAAFVAQVNQFEERVRILSEVGTPAPWQVVRNGTTYTISLPNGIQARTNPKTNRLWLYAPTISCLPAPLIPINAPYIWPNPPVKVPDGTVREDVDDNGDPILVVNTIEDPFTALKEIVARAVLGS